MHSSLVLTSLLLLFFIIVVVVMLPLNPNGLYHLVVVPRSNVANHAATVMGASAIASQEIRQILWLHHL